jgi:Alginate lyase
LSNWELDVPYSSTGSYTSGYATSIKQPTLATFSNSQFYLTQPTSSTYAVVMHTPVVGVTTSGSVHPRYEFREMTNSGTTLAVWGANDGYTHTMFTQQTVTHLPAVELATTVN